MSTLSCGVGSSEAIDINIRDTDGKNSLGFVKLLCCLGDASVPDDAFASASSTTPDGHAKNKEIAASSEAKASEESLKEWAESLKAQLHDVSFSYLFQ